MAREIFLGFRDEQASSKYPFSDVSSLLTTDAGDLGTDTILDAHLYPIGGGVQLSITTVVVTRSDVTLYIGTPDDRQLCFTTFDPTDPPDLLRVEDAYGRSAGVLVSEAVRLARFQSWAVGAHTFLEGAAEFVASVCCPSPEVGVRGVMTEDGEVFTGDVWLVGENGVVIREVEETGLTDARVISIDIVGDPLFKRALCETAGTPLAAVSYLKTINGLPPDEYGNFLITAGDTGSEQSILRIRASAGGLIFEAVGEKAGSI